MDDFSTRVGIKGKKGIQLNEMSKALKNKLWNCFSDFANSKISHLGYPHGSRFDKTMQKLVVDKILCDHFALIKDELPFDATDILKLLKKRYQKLEWNEVYDFFECVISDLEGCLKNKIIDEINNTLTSENLGYRISGIKFIPITSQKELKEINKASKVGESQVENHLKKAEEYLSPAGKNPDYPNSIKESISSVESFVKIILNNDKGLSENLKSKKLGIHPALESALNKIYGYTSNASGVRHGHKADAQSTPGREEAIFSLVVCSAYINLIDSKKVNK